MTVTPFLWFDSQAEEAARFYVSLLPDSRIDRVSRRGGPEAPVQTVALTLSGRPYLALNGGPTYSLTPAFSLQVIVETQAEIDDLWSRLTADGGEESRCGWLKDRFGLSWQIIPSALGKALGNPDPILARKAMTAMLGMKKIIIADL